MGSEWKCEEARGRMDLLSGHPVTVVLALISMAVWAAGNRNGNKKLVKLGIVISIIATGTFFLNLWALRVHGNYSAHKTNEGIIIMESLLDSIENLIKTYTAALPTSVIAVILVVVGLKIG